MLPQHSPPERGLLWGMVVPVSAGELDGPRWTEWTGYAGGRVSLGVALLVSG